MKHEDFLKELRQDPEYVAAAEELKPIFDIADEVLRLRLAKGWSQSELARRAGTKQANISKLENGLGNPTLGFLRRVAKALDTDLTIQLQRSAPRKAQHVILVQEIRVVQPEKLWGGASRQSVLAFPWVQQFPCPRQVQVDQQYEAA